MQNTLKTLQGILRVLTRRFDHVYEVIIMMLLFGRGAFNKFYNLPG